jgi:hypothetical protein
MTQLILGSSVPAIEFFLSILPGSLLFLCFHNTCPIGNPQRRISRSARERSVCESLHVQAAHDLNR